MAQDYLPWTLNYAEPLDGFLSSLTSRIQNLMLISNIISPSLWTWSNCLFDTITLHHAQGMPTLTVSPCPVLQLTTPASPFNATLKEFPAVTQLCTDDRLVKHTVIHHITTTGPPVIAQACRLPSEHPRIASVKFDHMLQLGISAPPPLAGLHHFTWSPKRQQVIGDHVATIMPSTISLYLTGTQDSQHHPFWPLWVPLHAL